MAPKFIFRIDEFTEHPQAIQQVDRDGKWIPTPIRGYNIRIAGGASGRWWYCDGRNIRLIPGSHPGEHSTHYKTYSTIYSGGHGLHVLSGDATDPPDGESWHHLWFTWNLTTYSSSLTNAGVERTLRVQDFARRWPHMLLPDIYHGSHYSHPGYGGLTGDLAILLSLVALSMDPGVLMTELPSMMHQGEWREHLQPHGRTDKRGVIVYVYAYGNNDDELEAWEEGVYGPYYK